MINDNIIDILPMLPMQTLIYAKSLHTYSDLDIVKCDMTFSRPIDIIRLKKAWSNVVKNNEILRTSFRLTSNYNFVQIIYRDAIYDSFTIIDKNEDDFSVDICKPIRLFFKTEEKCNISIYYHIILMDGWSFNLMLRELFQNYLEDRDISQYKNQLYIETISNLYKNMLRKSYHIVKSFEGTCNFPCSIINCKEREKRVLKIDIDINIWNAMVVWCVNKSISMAIYFYFCWAILLKNHCKREKVYFGITASGRNAVRVNDVYGLFINTFPVQVSFEKDDIQTTLNELKHDVFRILENEAYDMNKHCEEYCRFDTLVVFENHPVEETIKFLESQLYLSSYNFDEGAKYTLVFGILPHKKQFTIQYSGNSFSDEEISNLASELLNTFKVIISCQEIYLSDLFSTNDSQK